MRPAEIIAQVKADGVTLALAPDGTVKARGKESAVRRWLPVIRSHKAELLAELRAAYEGTHEPLPDSAAEARRKQVIAMLRESPGTTYAAITELRADPDNVILALSVRGRGTCELLIPRAKWDGVLFIDLLDKHCGTVH